VIDLRTHLLPGFADGPPDYDTALAMARTAVADGVLVAACTPVNQLGLAQPSPDDIRRGVAELEKRLIEAQVPLHVVAGSECHIRPGLVAALKSHELLPINGSRYVLVDLPRMVAPANFERSMEEILDEGFVPIIASPERLKWLEARFDLFQEMAVGGVWLQVTAGSLTGQFGKRPQYWAERLLGSSMTHILASDARDSQSHAPVLSEAFDMARKIVGEQAALDLVLTRPLNVLDNEPDEASPSQQVVVEETWGPVLELRSLLKRAG
jgi:protein-tyrosine phosphatase